MKGEDIEDDGAAVEDALVGEFLEITHLSRRQIVVEDDHVGVRPAGEILQLVRLAFANVESGIDAFAVLQNLADDGQRGRVGEAGEFVERFFGFPRGYTGQSDANEKGGFLGDFGRMGHGGNIPGSIQ